MRKAGQMAAGLIVLLALVLMVVDGGREPKAEDTGVFYATKLPDGRRVTAIKGYGLRCAVLWTEQGGMAADGSGDVSCVPGDYWGEWTWAKPR